MVRRKHTGKPRTVLSVRFFTIVAVLIVLIAITLIALNSCSSMKGFLGGRNTTQGDTTSVTVVNGSASGQTTETGSGTSGESSGESSGETSDDGASKESGDNGTSGDSGGNGNNSTSGSSSGSGDTSGNGSNTEPSTIEVAGDVKPDESGKVIVLMFHNFISTYSGGDKEWTTTFDNFRALLHNLYDRGYRLVNLIDYVKGNIDVPEGKIPIVFTFDDGTCGQFCLQEIDGALKVKKNSAVGVMEEFAEEHPDFGLKGTFYINLGDSAFPGAGTLQQRLQYLIDKGFEIGNHTYMHTNLKMVTTAEKMQSEVGANNNMMLDLIAGYSMDTISLPYGEPSKSLAGYVVKGVFEGIEYENLAVLKVGWDPNPSPFSAKFDPLDVHRVRSSGLISVDGDFDWWLAKLTIAEQYVSDGNPDTVTIPAAKQDVISGAQLNGRQLLIY